MQSRTFNCIEAHTCGNPVRLVTSGAPELQGATMSEKRQDFLARYDWIRTALMFEPQGHDLMSGSILYPAERGDCDVGILFIETSGCLPMCGHGTIGTVTAALESRLITPARPGLLTLETPAGRVETRYRMQDGQVEAVEFTNVASFVAARGLEVATEELGRLSVDVAYGGNFYAIVEPQQGYRDFRDFSARDLVRISSEIRRLVNEQHDFVHPEDPTIRGVSHVQWTGEAKDGQADGANAVFYGEGAIDRSPCGTGTSARMAQLAARHGWAEGHRFTHESIIGTRFQGRVVGHTSVGGRPAIVPAIEGWARVIGQSTRMVRGDDPLAHGFQVV